MKSRLDDALAKVLNETRGSGLSEVSTMVSSLQAAADACEDALKHCAAGVEKATEWASGA